MKDAKHTRDLVKRAALDLGTKTGGVPTTFNFSVFKRNISDESMISSATVAMFRSSIRSAVTMKSQ